MLRITVEYLPHGDEASPVVVGRAKVCNLRKHEAGSELGDFHAYFEANEPPQASEYPPFMPDDPRSVWHTSHDAIVSDYPRRMGGVWNLIGACLVQAGATAPVVHGGITLEAAGRD